MCRLDRKVDRIGRTVRTWHTGAGEYFPDVDNHPVERHPMTHPSDGRLCSEFFFLCRLVAGRERVLVVSLRRY